MAGSHLLPRFNTTFSSFRSTLLFSSSVWQKLNYCSSCSFLLQKPYDEWGFFFFLLNISHSWKVPRLFFFVCEWAFCLIAKQPRGLEQWQYGDRPIRRCRWWINSRQTEQIEDKKPSSSTGFFLLEGSGVKNIRVTCEATVHWLRDLWVHGGILTICFLKIKPEWMDFKQQSSLKSSYLLIVSVLSLLLSQVSSFVYIHVDSLTHLSKIYTLIPHTHTDVLYNVD